MINNMTFEEHKQTVWILIQHYNGEYKIIDVYDSREKAKARFSETLENIWHDGTIITIDDNYRSFQDCISDLSFKKYNNWLRVVSYEAK